jgi:hypothetical protein
MVINSFEDLQKVVDYLRPFHVKKIVVSGIEIEFDTAAALVASQHSPVTIDDNQDKIDRAKNSLEDLLADAKADELWSV